MHIMYGLAFSRNQKVTQKLLFIALIFLLKLPPTLETNGTVSNGKESQLPSTPSPPFYTDATDAIFNGSTDVSLISFTRMAGSTDTAYNASYFEVFFPKFLAAHGLRNLSEIDQCYYRNVTYYTLGLLNLDRDDGTVYCPHYYDQVFCWPPHEPGNVTRPCMSELNGIKYNPDEGQVTRLCLPNGTWGYNGKSIFTCFTDHEPSNGKTIHDIILYNWLLNIGHSLSLIALLGAFFIFFFFKNLRCVRNNIHWNLITSFILNYMWFYISSGTQSLFLERDDLAWLCKLTKSLVNNSVLTNFCWMLIEGIYLYLLVVSAMTVRREKFWMYMAFGWGVPVLITAIHSITRKLLETSELESGNDPDLCWHEQNTVDYIIYAPIIMIVVINLVILIVVVCVLVSKLRASHSFETKQYWKSVRATIVLLPLLGGAYFLFIHQPPDDSSIKLPYMYLQVIIQSVQGFFVALFYVYMNHEVISVLKRKFHRWKESHTIQSHISQPGTGFCKGSTFQSSQFPSYCPLANGDKVPSFVPGETVPLKARMDSTPVLSPHIATWAAGDTDLPLSYRVCDEPLTVDIDEGPETQNTIPNGKLSTSTKVNGNNNLSLGEQASPLLSPKGDGGNCNNHNNVAFTEQNIFHECNSDEENVFAPHEGTRIFHFEDQCNDPLMKAPLIKKKCNQRQLSSSSNCPLLEVDRNSALMDTPHVHWSPKSILKRISPQSSPQTQKLPKCPAVTEMSVDSIQLTENQCGTPV